MRRTTALSVLGLVALAPSLIQAQADADKNWDNVETPQQAQRPPKTLLEKNKSAKETPRLNPQGLDTRVVGGNQVNSKSKYPFYVEWEDANCGGSLVWGDIALSAAHCESTTTPFNSRVYVNSITDKQGVFRVIQNEISHPDYKTLNNNDYDFMILVLDKSALVDDNGDDTGAEVVQLNYDREVPGDGDPLMAVGFGLTEEGGGGMSDVLNDVQVDMASDDKCESQYGTDTFSPDLMLCAGVEGGGKDTCQGDSGGPIMDDTTGTQVGVVSYGIGCARASHFGVYARVSAVTEWIEEMICLHSQDPPDSCALQPGGGIDNGNGKLSLQITYDSYARETALSLKHDGSGETIYFQAYAAANAINGATETLEFNDLPAGDYTLSIGDDGRDGVCCGFGDGSFLLRDEKFGDDVWEISQTERTDGVEWTSSEFGEYVAGRFSIDNSGRVTFVETTTDYVNSWEGSPDPTNYPQNNDQSWPGPKPTDTKSININVKFDRFPQETSWELSRQAGNSDNFQVVESFNGATDGVHNDLLSIQLTNQPQGWYQLTFKDNGQDGICCEYRRGWLAVTGYLLVTRKAGLVWGNNGEFGSETTIYFNMNSNGMVTRITDDVSII